MLLILRVTDITCALDTDAGYLIVVYINSFHSSIVSCDAHLLLTC